MPRSYSKTVHIPAPGARSLAVLAVAVIIAAGAVAGRDALGGSASPTNRTREAPVVQATPLAATPEAERPVSATPGVAAPEGAGAVGGSPAPAPDAARVAQATVSTAQEGPGFARGDTVVVDADGLNLRRAPGLAGDIAAILRPGVPATVVAGPTAADGFTWYRLDVNGISGWAAGEFLAAA